MLTLQPTLRLGRDVWDRTAMPIEEFVDRVTRLREAMSRESLDALLLYGSGLNRCGHPTYVSNYIVKLPFSALVILPLEGDPALIFEGATRGGAAAKATTWIDDVRPCWTMSATCLEALKERNLLSATIGLAGTRLMPHIEWATLASGLRLARLVEADELVDRQRAIKSSREIGQIRRATEIAKRALEGVPSSSEPVLAAHAIRAARKQGAEDVRVMLSRPAEDGFSFRPFEDRPIADAELIAVSLCVSWERYWSEITRTFVARPEGLEPVWSDRLESRFQAVVAGAKPGVIVGDWARTAIFSMTMLEHHALHCVGLGHGIGVTPEEAPVLSTDEPRTIPPGMSLVIRAGLPSDHGVILHGDTIIT